MNLKEAMVVLDEKANKSLARIHAHVQDRNIGIITAHRGENSHAENQKRNTELMGHIRNHGFGFVHIRGKYVENKGEPNEKHNDEHSFMVIGKKGNDNGQMKGFLTKHGEKYGQDSVLHKPHNTTHAHLIGTRDGEWLKKGEHMNVGEFHPNDVGDYHSALRKGAARRGTDAYSVVDHTGKDVKKFETKKQAHDHLAAGLKSKELEHGSNVKYNARSFAFADKVGPKNNLQGSFKKMSKKNEEIETQEDNGVFEDFNFWTPTTWFNRTESLWVPSDMDLKSE